MRNNYYVYGYFDPDTEIPFYIGYGHGDRMNEHLRDAKKNKQKSHKINKILSILEKGKIPIIKKIDENISKEDATELEEFLIDLIGRSDLGTGSLTNLTIGGDGHREWTEEQRKEASQRNIGQILVRDQEGKLFKIRNDDPRWLSGDLVGVNRDHIGITNKNGHLTGYIICKDLEGNSFRVKNDDPRWLSGDLVGVNRNKTPPQTTIDAAKRRKGEKKPEGFGKRISELMTGVPKSDECKRKLSESNKGLRFYNNGNLEIKSKSHPGDGWKLGRLRKQIPEIQGDGND